MSASAKRKPAPQDRREPSFSVDQLADCKALPAGRDVVRAVLEPGGSYTLEEAQKAIEFFMKRKV